MTQMTDDFLQFLMSGSTMERLDFLTKATAAFLISLHRIIPPFFVSIKDFCLLVALFYFSEFRKTIALAGAAERPCVLLSGLDIASLAKSAS